MLIAIYLLDERPLPEIVAADSKLAGGLVTDES